MGKRVLITGGSGFIGKNLVELFSAKYDICAPTHKELELLSETSVDDFFKNNKFDVVVHTAAKAGHRFAKDADGILNSNTRIFFNLVKNLGRFGKMIYVGSGLVYGLNHYKPKMKEDYFGTHIPDDEAGYSKYLISKYIEGANNIVDLRVFGVFGKYEEYAIRFISNAICKTLYDLPITIKQNRLFDYICVEDLARVVEFFVENKVRHFAYNVTPDRSVELKSLAEKIRVISKKDLPIKIARDGMGVEYSGSNARLCAEFAPKFLPLDDAIVRLYGWYEENKKNINRDLLLTDY